jgi:hypothetical protein
LSTRAAGMGLHGVRVGVPVGGGPPVLVASYGDMKKARRYARRVVMMEHGTGQTYQGAASGSYVGAFDRELVHLVLVPNDAAKAAHDAAHPRIPSVVIGSPYLDHLATLPTPDRGLPCLSFHWDCQAVPETRTAWPEYAHLLPDLRTEIGPLFGHSHPRLWDRSKAIMLQAGMTLVRDFPDVVQRASVYAIDNSSTLFLFAALDRPVVVINSKHYRRDVHHGGRFWDWADVGPQVDHPSDLPGAMADALKADPTRRRQIVDECFPHRGDAAQRAVKAIEEVFHG